MPTDPGQDNAPGLAPDSVTFEAFSGLRNTVKPERLGPRELARATNIDLDDAGMPSRRQGQKRVTMNGGWHSLFSTEWQGRTWLFAVQAGVLCLVNPDYTTLGLVGGMPPDKLWYVHVNEFVYFSNDHVSGKLSLASLRATPWGARTDHSYVPATTPQVGRDFWLSPVPLPDPTLPAVAGRLVGPPPLGKHLCLHNGRIYLAQDNVLWATDLYSYNFVDKTEGYRSFEDLITGISAVDDGVFVGTKSGLFFVGGPWKEQRRTLKEKAGVIPGTMIEVPGALADPEHRQRPDVPPRSQRAMSCMTTDGLVVGFTGGDTVNMTRSAFDFPDAVRGAAAFRKSGGFNSLIAVLQSDGPPQQTNAAFGDYVSTTLIRNGVVIPE